MYQCLKCGGVYKYKIQMVDHLRKVHGVAKVKEPELYYLKIVGGSPGVWTSYC